MSEPLLRVEGLGLSFAGVRALDDVSLDVQPGEVLAVIGPNGAGKTSLFNCISAVYRPSQGRILFDGHELSRLQPHRLASLGIGRMFQNLAIFEHLSTLDNLLLGRHHLYRSRWWQDLLFTARAREQAVLHRRRVEEIIELLELERYRAMPAGILPYGVLKRIELGRALAMEPRLLLMDEPAAGLNQEETEDLARFLTDVREELEVTILLIEHELRFVVDLADRVAVLDFGRLIAEGLPEEVARDPLVVEAYVGTAEGLLDEATA